MKQSLGAWGTLDLSYDVPKANQRYNAHLFSQDTADPRILLSVTGTHLFIESKGASVTGWTFGQLVYSCEQYSVSQPPIEAAKTSGSASYESFRVDLPTAKMGCLICVYNNRPLCSTVFPISHFIKYNTNASNCVDCYYVSDVSLHATAYYQNGYLYLQSGNKAVKATFVVFQYSVSQISKNPKIYVGTKVVNNWGTAGQLKVFTPTEFSTLFGGEFGTHTYDCVLVMNGDGNANGVYLSAAGYWAGDGIWVKTLNGSGSSNIRINYVVVRLQHSVSHDYIVEQGRSGIWMYRKWNSGVAEFWGGKPVSGVGSINVPAVDFPFALTELIYKSASAIYSSGVKGVYILSGSGASTSLVNTGVYKVSQDVQDNSSTTYANIEYNVKGMWKQQLVITPQFKQVTSYTTTAVYLMF